MSWQYKLTSFAGAAIAATLMSGTFLATASAEEVVLKMAVPDWPPTRIMKEMFDKEYKAPSGNTVKLDIDYIPWPDFYTRVNASLTSGEQKYNMAVSDSQWLGAFIEGGYYRKINDLIDADPNLKATMDDMHEAVRNAYSTYPYKSTNYYGFPQFPDVLVTYLGDRAPALRVCGVVSHELRLADLNGYVVVISPAVALGELPVALVAGLLRDVGRCQAEQQAMAVIVEPEMVHE